MCSNVLSVKSLIDINIYIALFNARHDWELRFRCQVYHKIISDRQIVNYPQRDHIGHRWTHKCYHNINIVSYYYAPTTGIYFQPLLRSLMTRLAIQFRKYRISTNQLYLLDSHHFWMETICPGLTGNNVYTYHTVQWQSRLVVALRKP